VTSVRHGWPHVNSATAATAHEPGPGTPAARDHLNPGTAGFVSGCGDTFLDAVGYSAERRLERKLVTNCEATIGLARMRLRK